jgi:hypothetical protein
MQEIDEVALEASPEGKEDDPEEERYIFRQHILSTPN